MSKVFVLTSNAILIKPTGATTFYHVALGPCISFQHLFYKRMSEAAFDACDARDVATLFYQLVVAFPSIDWKKAPLVGWFLFKLLTKL